MEIRGNIIEEYGIKANELGLFNKWQSLKTIIQEQEKIPGFEAAEKAYTQLKNQR